MTTPTSGYVMVPREALKPFAKIAASIPDGVPGSAQVVLTTLNGGIIDTHNRVTVENLRTIAAILVLGLTEAWAQECNDAMKTPAISDEMREKIARAICRAGITGPPTHLDAQENLHWRRFMNEANAAILAIGLTGDAK